MTGKRFEVGESENQYIIFDNEGADDYYHLGNDERDVKSLCKLMNELLEEPAKLKETVNQLKRTLKTLGEDYTKLTEENKQLKAQLLYDGEDVCNICKHQYLVESREYYVAKCEKGHEECGKGTVMYCKDFKFKELK